jgi:hypothetical protein
VDIPFPFHLRSRDLLAGEQGGGRGAGAGEGEGEGEGEGKGGEGGEGGEGGGAAGAEAEAEAGDDGGAAAAAAEYARTMVWERGSEEAQALLGQGALLSFDHVAAAIRHITST